MLRPGKRIRLGQSGLGGVVGVDKSREYVYMPAFVDNERNKNQSYYSLMKVSLENPTKLKSLEKGQRHTIDYFTDGFDNIIARESYSNASNRHVLEVRNGKKWKSIFKQKADIKNVSFSGISSDRRSIVGVKTDPETNYHSYFSLSLIDGVFKHDQFMRQNKDVAGLLKDINRVVYGVRYSGFSPSYQFFDPKLNAKVKAIIEQFPEQSVYVSSWSPDWQHIVVYVTGKNYVGDYFLFSDGEKAAFLSSAYPAIKSEDIHPTVSLSYKARDAMEIPLLLTIPKDKVALDRALPAVLLPHGGPESYDRIGFDWLVQALANEGYIVIQPQFRGSYGFGRSHAKAGYGEWGKKMQDDLTDAVSFLKGQKIIDPERVCVVGASYGGYAALAGGAFTPELYRCVVSINGVSDLPKMMRAERSDHGRDHWVLSYWKKVMTDRGTKVDMKAVSPSYFAKNFKAPVLLIHGEKDNVVPFSQSKLMMKKLKSAGKSVTLLKLKDENHYLEHRATRIKTLKSLTAFLSKNLK